MYADSVKQKGACRKAFLIALVTAAVIFVPFMIWDKGYFFFFGDFNVQQIPFYKLAHEAVRTGDIFWSWYTDLGANFIGSYSFYLIGSPFFWLTLPFPTEFVPYLMAPLLILKHACAACTGTLFIKRFTRNKDYAVLGGLLYAFSGFAVYNIFFNHFHEVIVFFPLMLVGLEELIVHNRRGIFAVSVAINAFVNYWFFIGEVVFILLYFFVRCTSKGWRMNARRFLLTAFESVLGMMIAMCLFLPAVLAILGNPRTGASELLDGWNLWLYWHNQMYPAIVGSAFFPPDLPSRPNLFPDRGAKWASLSAFLPLFSMAGVIAYINSKRDWLRKILLVSFVIALVPALNSMFIMFNNSYYARWFYMPLLMMALATVRALESRTIDMSVGFRWTTAVTAIVTVILGLTPRQVDGKWTLGITKYPDRFAVTAAIALLSLTACIFIYKKLRGRKNYMRVMTGALCVVIVVYSSTFIGMGKTHSDDTDFIRNVALDGRYKLELPGDTFARADIYDGMDNLGMYWHLPNLQAFHSIVPVSIMEFYPKVGVKRDVSSKPETSRYPLRSLLSTRWLFIAENEQQQEPMPGWELHSNQLDFNVYENRYFVPMGFTYDSYITAAELDNVPEEERAAVMLHTIVLNDNAAALDGDLLPHLAAEEYSQLTRDDYFDDCEARRATAAHTFTVDKNGFTAKIYQKKENLVFFSVPHDSGWSATINGNPARIDKANIGFMAVRAPAGESVIRFTYTTPGLAFGIIISVSGVLLLIIYLLIWRRRRGEPIEPPELPAPCRPDPAEPPYDGLRDELYTPIGEAFSREKSVGRGEGTPSAAANEAHEDFLRSGMCVPDRGNLSRGGGKRASGNIDEYGDVIKSELLSDEWFTS